MKRASISLAILALCASPAFATPGCGDVNGDGQLSIIDALLSAQYAAGTLPLSPTQLTRSDVNGDSLTNILDSLVTAQRSASLPVTIRCVGMMPLSGSTSMPPPAVATTVYVAVQYPNELTLADRTTGAVTGHLALPQMPTGVVADPTRDRIYVSYGYGSSVGVVDTTTDTVVSTIAAPGLSGHIDVSEDGTTLVGITQNGLVVVDLPGGTVRHQVYTGGYPSFLSITPDGQAAWVNDGFANTVHKVSLTSGSIVATVPVGNQPFGVSVAADGSQVFVINHGDQTLSRIDTATNLEILPRQPVGVYPMAVLGHTNGYCYSVNCISANIGEHDAATGQQRQVFGVGQEPIQMQEMAGGDVVVINSFSNFASILDLAGGRHDIYLSGSAVDAAGK